MADADDVRWVGVEGAALASYFDDEPLRDGARGAPLVFLHAGVADARMWQPQRDAFVAEGHPVLRYDRRGFGQTKVHAAGPYSRTADLWAVMDAHRLERAVLVGGSQGGRVALDAALQRPERVQALVLVAPAVTGAPDAPQQGRVQELSDAIDAATARGDTDAVNELEAQLWLEGPSSPPGRVQGVLRELFLAMNDIALRAADPGEAIEAPSAWARLEAVQASSLVIWGALDLPHLLARCEEMTRRLPRARGVRLEGTAHLPGLEAPQRFNEALRAFFRESRLTHRELP